MEAKRAKNMKNQYEQFKKRVQSQNQTYSLSTAFRTPPTNSEMNVGKDRDASISEFEAENTLKVEDLTQPSISR